MDWGSEYTDQTSKRYCVQMYRMDVRYVAEIYSNMQTWFPEYLRNFRKGYMLNMLLFLFVTCATASPAPAPKLNYISHDPSVNANMADSS